MKTTLVQWDDNLATGIDWQDMQHQQLLNHLHKLYEALMVSSGVKDELKRLLPFLEDYAKKHLSMEAEVMWEHGFEETDAHLEQHTSFYRQLDDVKRHLAESEGSDSVSVAANLCMELNNWFIEHIRTYDQRLGAFLKQAIEKKKR